ncbi:NepR family anti-sigma factor [Microvirga makkahensis]|uniref:Anti-sigma factor NepR domain-containing protein n=1 Tax=Microvirga makkahensis TaxID=1128670 RepID=A0A7X3MTY0_9HYPH|nr:NepR family anti-sigma factor [Microvirga makkahensis]MXQ12988.1 hypothetical protein [Microvirga makkahensis]
MKKSPPDDDVASLGISDHWSIGSSQLTAKGEAELMRHIGAKLEACYAQIVSEPLPDRFTSLLVMLDANTRPTE